jgi:hypothetical protein
VDPVPDPLLPRKSGSTVLEGENGGYEAGLPANQWISLTAKIRARLFMRKVARKYVVKYFKGKLNDV